MLKAILTIILFLVVVALIYDFCQHQIYPESLGIIFKGKTIAGYTGSYSFIRLNDNIVKVEFTNNNQTIVWFFCGDIKFRDEAKNEDFK